MSADRKIPEGLAEALQDALDRPIAFHRVFVTLTGSVTAALMLSQAMYWTKRTGPDGWFFKTIKQWEEETGLSRHEQQSARKTLRKFSFWHEDLRGIPAKMHYHVDIAALSHDLLCMARPSSRKSNKDKKPEKKGVPSGLLEPGKLVCAKPANKNAGKQPTSLPETGQHYKGVSEITSKTTTTTPLSPLQRPPGDPGGRDFVEKLLAGTMLHGARSARIAHIAKRYNRSNEEIKTAIDVLTQQYHQSARMIYDPTSLVVCALRDGLDPPEGHVPKAMREKEAEKRQEFARKKVDEKRRVQEAEEAAYKAAGAKLSALSDKDREELFAKAKAGLPSILRDSKKTLWMEAREMIISRARAPGGFKDSAGAPR